MERITKSENADKGRPPEWMEMVAQSKLRTATKHDYEQTRGQG